MQEVADLLELNQSSVARLAERLEREGSTIRDACPNDKSGVYTVLTETAGRAGTGTFCSLFWPMPCSL